MKKTKIPMQLIFLFGIIAIVAGFFIDVKTVMIILFSLILLISYIFYKEKVGEELLLAFLIAFAWTSYYFYEYTTQNIYFGTINLFPLVSWTFGLVLLREVYERIRIKYRFLLISAIYMVSLIIMEAIGYYILGIKLNSNFPSLFGIGVLHTTVLAKIFYITVGPIYLLVTDYLKVK